LSLSAADSGRSAEPNTLVLDISRSWTPSTAQFSIIRKPRDAPTLNRPTLWYNIRRNELLQGFGGSVSPLKNGSASASSSAFSLWKLKPDDLRRNGTWTQERAPGHAALAGFTRPVGGLTTSGDGVAYLLGGYASSESGPSTLLDQEGAGGGTPLPGLIWFDLSPRAAFNYSARKYYGTGSAQRGQMVRVPGIGAQGVYVMLGGDSAPLANYVPGQSLVSFANITVYDRNTQRWYWQTASGDVPRPRMDFCADGAYSTNKTFEM
jgi:hypothetical protein